MAAHVEEAHPVVAVRVVEGLAKDTICILTLAPCITSWRWSARRWTCAARRLTSKGPASKHLSELQEAGREAVRLLEVVLAAAGPEAADLHDHQLVMC